MWAITQNTDFTTWIQFEGWIIVIPWQDLGKPPFTVQVIVDAGVSWDISWGVMPVWWKQWNAWLRTSIGKKWNRKFSPTSNSAWYASKQNIALSNHQGYCSLCPFPIRFGRTFPWISSRDFLPLMASLLFLWWLIVLPKDSIWATLLLVSLLIMWQNCLWISIANFMVCPRVLFLFVTPSSLVTFGPICSNSVEPCWEWVPRITLKLTGKPR